VADSKATAAYEGIALFASMNPSRKDAASEKQVTGAAVYSPYQITKKLTIGGYTSDSGKDWTLTANPWLFKDMVVEELDG